MTIQLSDISTATSVYLEENVEVRLARVTSNLEPGEDGTFTVRWSNAAAPLGVRLTQLFLHLSVSPGSVAKLKVPGAALLEPRSEADPDGPRLPTDDLVEEMFLFLPPDGLGIDIDSSLDVGEVVELELGYSATGPGTATICAHVHASVAVADLFPSDRGTAATKDAVIRAVRTAVSA